MKKRTVYFIALTVIIIFGLILTSCGSSSTTAPGTKSPTAPVLSRLLCEISLD